MSKPELLEDWWRVFQNVMAYKDGKYFRDNMTVFNEE